MRRSGLHRFAESSRLARKLITIYRRNHEKTASCLRLHRHPRFQFGGLCPGLRPRRAASTCQARSDTPTHASRLGMAGRILSLVSRPVCLGSRQVCSPAARLCSLDPRSLAQLPARLCLGSRPLEIVDQRWSIRGSLSADGSGRVLDQCQAETHLIPRIPDPNRAAIPASIPIPAVG